MKKSKKLIAILCSLALSINMCSVWVFADNKPTVSLDNSNKQIIAMDDITNDVTENEIQIIETEVTKDKPDNMNKLENIALGASAKSNIECYQYHPVSEITDGERNISGTGSRGSFAQIGNDSGDWYITVDLGSQRTVKMVVLGKTHLPGEDYNNNPSSYQIQISNDGQNWVQLGTAEEETEKDFKDVYFIPKEPQTAQYVRLYVPNAQPWCNVDEIEVYDTAKMSPVISNYVSGSTLHKGDQIVLTTKLDGTIYYTDDGTDPTTSETRKTYTEPITVDGDITIKTYAVSEGMPDSDVTTYQYFMQYLEASPAPGNVEKGTEVTFTNYLENSTIWYTTDESDPTTSDTAVVYTAPIVINEYTNIRAYAKQNDGLRSTPVYNFVYATENIGVEADITVSAEKSGNEAENVLDNNAETMWQPTGSSDEWIKFDFGTPIDFYALNIVWADEDANYKYIVETSSDNYVWYTYYNNTAGNIAGQTHEISNLETHRQYMRIKILGANSGATYGIREVQIVGKESAEVPEIPMYDNPETDIYDRVVVNPMPDKVDGVENSQISLNGEWNFTMFPQNGFWRDSTDLSKWDKASIPGELDAQGFPVYKPDDPDWTGNYATTPWRPGNNIEMAYKQEFEVPADFADQKVFLRVDKAINYARVWVNGQFVRDHRGEYNAWDADITDYIKPGEKNWITISITREGSDGFSFVGLHHYCGILSDITMYATPNTYLNRLHVVTDLDEDYKDAELTVMTNAFLEEGRTADVKLNLKDMEGNDVALETDTIHIDKNFTDTNVTMTIDNPAKWDPEHPNLYTLTADVVVDGKVVETVVRKIGFREITIEPNEDGVNVFEINGIPTKLRGVNYLTAYGTDNNAYDFEIEKKLLESVKSHNVNYIRAAHYPLSDKTLELCDELGIVVEQEHSVTFRGGDVAGSDAGRRDFYSNYLLHNVSEMVEKDRSHPCIVMWSIANESEWGPNHDKTSRYIKAVEPTIPTKFSWGSQVPADAAIDIQSNHYSMDGVGRYGRPTVWDEYAHSWSNGDEANVRFDSGFRDNYYQVIKTNWEQIYNNPINLGGAIWCYIDNAYEGKNRVMGNTYWGQIDIWGREKPEGWATKNVYAPAQYKGEEFVAMPGKNKDLVLPYENRYETVNFNDADFEILYSINDGEWNPITSDIAAKQTGEIAIPAPKDGWKLGDEVKVEFYKTTNGIRRNVVTNLVKVVDCV